MCKMRRGRDLNIRWRMYIVPRKHFFRDCGRSFLYSMPSRPNIGSRCYLLYHTGLPRRKIYERRRLRKLSRRDIFFHYRRNKYSNVPLLPRRDILS